MNYSTFKKLRKKKLTIFSIIKMWNVLELIIYLDDNQKLLNSPFCLKSKA